MAEMESQPNHPKVKSARQHDLASKYYRQKMAFDFTNKQKINMFEMFKQPKFKNTVGETKHDNNLAWKLLRNTPEVARTKEELILVNLECIDI